MSKGSDAERELCEILWKKGYAVLRAPGSGSIDRPSPDVFAIRSGPQDRPELPDSYAFEIKANADGTAYFDSDEIAELREWANRAGALPFVAIRPDLRKFDGWLCRDAHTLQCTEQGYSLRQQDHPDCSSLDNL